MRRPIASREKGWAKQTAKFLAARGVRPNAVSGASVVCALLACVCLVCTRIEYSMPGQIALWLGAALFIQMRLLCNLFDGMLAVEFGQKSPLGPIYNDLPDRPADVLILAGAGYSLCAFAWLPTVAWVAAVLALMTAYVRVLGVAGGAPESFMGPMAKPHRMAILTIATILSTLETLAHWPHRAVALALLVVVVGCLITIARRLKMVANALSNSR